MYQTVSRFSKALGFLLLVVTASGCIDHTYDLEKVDRNVHIGQGDYSLPLGTTDKFTVGDLVGDSFDELISRNSDGTYSISYGSDPYDLSFSLPQGIDRTLGLKQYKGKYIDLTQELFSKPSNVTFDAEGKADLSKKITASRKFTTKSYRLPFTISNLPKQLNGIESILLTDDSQVKVSFSVPDCLLTEGTITPDINFDLHELFEVEGYPDGIVNFSDIPLTAKNGYKSSKTLKLKKVVIDPASFNAKNRTLAINAHLKIEGKCDIADPKTTKARYQSAGSAKLIMRIQLVNVLCKGVEGMFVYEVDSVRTRLKLAKVADKFGGDDSPVTFTSPELQLSYSGDFSVPTKATATFIAQRNGVTTAQIKNVPFTLPVASGSKTAKRVFRFSSTGKSTSGTTGVKANIPALFKTFPDIIYVYLDIATDANKVGILEIDRKYQMQLDLKISSPLGYGPGLKLETEKTFSLPSQLGDLLRENSLQLLGEINNTTPLKADLSLVMTDDNGTPLTEEMDVAIAGSGKTNLEMTITPLPGVTLEKLSKASMHLQAQPQKTGQAIKATDYIQARLEARILDGFYFSF